MKIANLEAKPTCGPAIASLRSLNAFSEGVEVDLEAGIIRNCAVMTIGPTIGHPFAIDGVTLQQTRDLINAIDGGAKSRFKHPGTTAQGTMVDDAGTVIGVLAPRTRIVGEHLRGDVYIGEYAANGLTQWQCSSVLPSSDF